MYLGGSDPTPEQRERWARWDGPPDPTHPTWVILVSLAATPFMFAALPVVMWWDRRQAKRKGTGR